MVLEQCDSCGACSLAAACGMGQREASMDFRKKFHATDEVVSRRSTQGALFKARLFLGGFAILAGLSVALLTGRCRRTRQVRGFRELQMLHGDTDADVGSA